MLREKLYRKFLAFMYSSAHLRFKSVISKCFSKSGIILSHGSKNRVLVTTQLSTGKGRNLAGAV